MGIFVPYFGAPGPIGEDVQSRIHAAGGTSLLPGLSVGDFGTGLWSDIAHQLKINTNGIAAMWITGSQNIIIGGAGVIAPDDLLHVYAGSAGAVTGYVNSQLIVESDTACSINLLAPNAVDTAIYFGNVTSNVRAAIIHRSTSDSMDFRVGDAIVANMDVSAVARDTRLSIYDVDNGVIERVSVGIADSGGAGFKLLRIPN